MHNIMIIFIVETRYLYLYLMHYHWVMSINIILTFKIAVPRVDEVFIVLLAYIQKQRTFSI